MFIDDLNDATRIYRNSLIRVGINPIRVDALKDAGKILIIGTNIRNNEKIEIDVNSPLVNNEPVPTGFVNGYDTAIYIARRTSRTYSQGLTSENMMMRQILQTNHSNRLYDEIITLSSAYLCNMIDGLYPSLEEAISRVQEKLAVSAFGRNQAVDKYMNIYYRCRRIGTVNQDNAVIKIDPAYKHFKWVFEQKCE